ncbi:MAG: hypothetical protein J7502_04740 [Flavisolibacter sp.]|nr:hypothetical protein [Flavisolibacter sp.]
MNTYLENSIADYCNQFSQNGNALSVTWQLGDCGREYVRIVPFNRNGEKRIEIEEEITELIDSFLRSNAYSYNYISKGKVTYDSISRSFIGRERFLEADIFEGECNLEIKIPAGIYFNQIEVAVRGGYADPVVAFVRFLLRDGTPLTDEQIDKERKRLETYLSRAFKKMVPRKNLLDTNNLFRIKRGAFKRRKGFLISKIDSFEYEFKIVENRDVRIPIL